MTNAVGEVRRFLGDHGFRVDGDTWRNELRDATGLRVFDSAGVRHAVYVPQEAIDEIGDLTREEIEARQRDLLQELANGGLDSEHVANWFI